MQPECVLYDNETGDEDEDNCNDRSTNAITYYLMSNDFVAATEIRDAVSLMRVNSSIRREVALLTYTTIFFSAWTMPLFASLMDNFMPYIKSILRFLQIPMPQVHHPEDTRLLRQGLRSLLSLEVVIVTRCSRVQTRKGESCKWSIPTLLALKAAQRAYPQLKYSYHLEERSA